MTTNFNVNNIYDRILMVARQMRSTSSSTYTLPNSLQSIADLTTSGNEILYTTGTDTYTLQSNVTSFGRGFLIQTSQNTAQSYIGTRVGTDVQAFSSVLSGLSSTALTADDILYATSATSFSTVSSTSFGRSVLTQANASELQTLLGSVGSTGSSSSDNAIARWYNTGINTIQNSSSTISDSGILNTSGIEVDTIDPKTSTITINSQSIPNANWAFIKTVNQDLSTTSTPNFSTIACNSITLTSPITSNSQAATKSYVDSVASSGLQPVEAVRVATTEALSATYSSGTERFTASGNGAISIDSVSLALNDRILVKNENGGTGTSNGIYSVTVVGDGSNPYQITRTADFNSAAEPISENTFIFVEEGTTNNGTQWILTETVTTIDTTNVIFAQFGGSSGLVAGSGIDITSNTIAVDASSAFLNAPLGFSQGGTNVTSFGSGDRLIQTNAGNTALEISSLDPSNVVTLSGSQILLNKTLTGTNNIIRASSLGTTDADVIINTADAPSAGEVLTAVNSTSASWQSVSVNTNRTVTVATSGGDYTSIASAIADIGTNSRLTPAASASSSITIQVAPGTYTESQIVVPPYVTIRGMGEPLNSIVTASDPTDDLFILSYAGSVVNIDARGVTTAGKAAFRISYAVGAGPTTKIVNCIARGCPIGFYCNGTTDQFSSVALLYNCNLVSTASGAVTSGYLADAGAVLVGFNCTVSGFFAGSINLSKGYDVTGSGSIMTLYSCDCSFVGTAYNVDAGAEFRITGGNAGNFENYGLDLGASSSVARLLSVFFQDNTALFANQIAVRTQTGSELLQLTGCILRKDLISLDSGTRVAGLSSSPGETDADEITVQILGELSVGLPGRGGESAFGEGDSAIFNMSVKRYNANTTTFDTVTSTVSFANSSTVAAFPSNTVGDLLYIGNTSRNFQGIKIIVDTAAVPAGCNAASTEPPDYSVTWEYYNGSTWVEFRHFTSLSSSPYTPYRRDSFRSGSYQVRFENIIQTNSRRPLPSTATFVASNGPGGTNKWVTSNTTPSAWAQTTIDSVNAYWVRVRLNTVLTTVPTIDQIKLHTNRTEINADGVTEFFGSAIQRTQLGITIRNFYSSATNSPSNNAIYVSDTINFSGVDNEFKNGVEDALTATFYIPPEVCTSYPSILVWRWFPHDATSGNVRWKISWAYTRPASIDSGAVSTLHRGTGSAPTTQVTEQSITFTVPAPGTTGKIVETFTLIDISDTVFTYANSTAGLGDILYINLAREGDEANDTYENFIYK